MSTRPLSTYVSPWCPSSKRSRNTTAVATATTGTRSDNCNDNRDTRQQHGNCEERGSASSNSLHQHGGAGEWREGKYIRAIQREKGRVEDTEREMTCRCRERKDVVLIMVLIEDVVLDCIDRERADIVVDDVVMCARDVLAFQVLLLLLKAMPRRWNTTSGIQQISITSSGMRTGNNHHYQGHDQVITGQQATRPCRTPMTVQ